MKAPKVRLTRKQREDAAKAGAADAMRTAVAAMLALPEARQAAADQEEYLSARQALEELRRQVAEAPTQRAWAASKGISEQMLSDVLTGRRNPMPEAIAVAAGLLPVTRYIRRKRSTAP